MMVLYFNGTQFEIHVNVFTITALMMLIVTNIYK